MKRRMLINAQRPEELRIALISDETLDDYQVAAARAGLTRGNIYRGVVTSVQPSLNAAFVNYGAERDAMVRAGDIVPQAWHKQPGDDARHPRIERVLERNRPILLQITKDPSGSKGAGATTNISLAGRYLVLMPYDEVRGISRKVEEEEERRAIREASAKLQIPEGFGFIVRTNALDQNKTALNRDLNALLRLWKRIRGEANRGQGPKLLYSDQDLIVQAVRDLLESSVDEVLVDDDEAFEKVRAAMRAFMPRAKTKLVRYDGRLPLFSNFKLEDQIESIFQPRVDLPSGASIIIEGTEALTAIDVNSGRSTRAGSEEETAFATNREAATEVARQLRLRDIGGLIVVDFIDMRSRKHQREVEKILREAVKGDRARVYVGRISPNGLLEINRQRLKTPLVLRTHRLCPTCGGGGRIPSPETVSLGLLRRIEERAAGGGLAAVTVRLHPELADALQNGYRHELARLESRYEIRIEVVAAPGLHRSQEEIDWARRRGGDEHAAAARPADAAVQVTDLTSGGGPRSAAPASQQPEKADEGAAKEGTASTRSRRRRGGRRRKKPSVGGENTTLEGDTAAEAAQDQPAEPVTADSPESDREKPPEADAAADRPAPRRRRRGGRRRRRPAVKGDAGAGNESAGDEAPAAAPSEPSPPPPPPAEPEPPTPADPGRRWRWPFGAGLDD